MTVDTRAQLLSGLEGAQATLHQVRGDMAARVLPVLVAAGVALLGSSGQAESPWQRGLLAVGLFALPIPVWSLRERSPSGAARLLVAGCLLVVLLLPLTGQPEGLAQLLALPVGLAVLLVGPVAGLIAAVGCTVFIWFGPTAVRAQGLGASAITVMIIWGTYGLAWLAVHAFTQTITENALQTATSRRLLEEARDAQGQLRQALRDLAEANLQLTRMHRLAQGLRHLAEESRRTKERFVANVSHELRTPLNMVIGFSEMILRAPDVYGGQLPAKLMADLDVVRRNARHLSQLIDDVLDLSQIEAGQMALSKEQVSLPAIVLAAAAAARPLYESKGLYLRLEGEDYLPPVFCDATRIRQVILNLLSNAGRFTERGGVSVRVWAQGAEAAVSVADTGPGIAVEARDELFQPFHQLGATTRRQFGGSGLGLSISKSFVELHGGRIWFESEQNVGTTFQVRLPLAPPPVTDAGFARWFGPYLAYEERAHPPELPVPDVRPRYVVLEARRALQRLLARYLGSAEVVPAGSISDALAELRRQPAHALLVNALPPSRALDILNEGVELPYGTPMIVCSIPDLAEAAEDLHVQGYLVKPVSREALLEALDGLRLRGNTLLVVDDEPDALRLFRRILLSAGRGYKVLKAEDGQQAMALLREAHPDVVLLDLVMPNMDGYRVLAEMRDDAALRGIPVIVISARDPAGQPLASNAVAVTKRDGLSVSEMIACVSALTGTLSVAARTDDRAQQVALLGSPASG